MVLLTPLSFTTPANSGPGIGLVSGGVPGQIGIWVCPGEGCQISANARSPPSAITAQSAKIKNFIARPDLRFPDRYSLSLACRVASRRHLGMAARWRASRKERASLSERVAMDRLILRWPIIES